MLINIHDKAGSVLGKRTPRAEWLRGGLGSAVGVSAAGAAGLMLSTMTHASLPWLLAPVGASAVLIFAIPASPLAQPWPVIGGNAVSAAVGLALGHILGVPLLSAALGLGIAMIVMGLARCLHPPGGACAVLYALGASGPEAWGFPHLLTIMVNVTALAAAGWIYNNATGHSWPHRPQYVPRGQFTGVHSSEVHRALTSVLAEWDEIIDADIHDLDAIFLAVERRIRSREQDAPIVTD